MLTFASLAHAQDIRAAEAAWLHGNFEQARLLALASIESGVHTARTLAPAYRVLAMAHAKLGDLDAARRVFVAVLGLDPAFRLDGSAPAEVRSPYMEARGYWSDYATPLSVKLHMAPPGVRAEVTDPASLGHRLIVRLRADVHAPFTEIVRSPAPQLSLPFSPPPEQWVDYTVVLLDEHGNRIWQEGSDEQPLHLAPVAAGERLSPQLTAPSASVAVTAPRSRVYRGTGGALLALSAVGLSGAVFAHVKREQTAQDWNSFRCSGKGQTRGELCEREGERISKLERIAVSLYGAGGAALVSGLLLLVLSPPERRGGNVLGARCSFGPGELGVGCKLPF